VTRAAELCTDCGICCDGTLFSSVTLEDADVPAVRQHRLPMLETQSSYKLELPCAALRGVLCEIYDERPETCADFACELLTRVDERRTSFAKARGIIAKTRAARSRVDASIGDTPWWVAHRSALEAQREPGWAEANAQLVEDLKTLDGLVRRHFWG
jgi:Fe-S-cluster containining protein